METQTDTYLINFWALDIEDMDNHLEIEKQANFNEDMNNKNEECEDTTEKESNVDSLFSHPHNQEIVEFENNCDTEV